MAIEETLAANTAAVDKNTAMLSEVLAQLKSNTASLDKLVEGRDKAIEAIIAAEKAPTTTSTRKPSTKKKEEEPSTSAEPEAVETSDTSIPEGWNPDLSDDGIKAAVSPYLATGDEAARGKAMENVLAILQYLGCNAVLPTAGKTHPESDDQKRQMLFFVERFKEGLPVNFKADYDFDQNPLEQANEVKAAASEDPGLGV